MKELQDKLHLPKLPYQIECFDNSNIAGTDAVASCVVFKAMKPSKKDYKHFNIKTVEGPDDYASMKEVVHRRYTRQIEEEQHLPDLIIADGGKGQMEVIRQVIQDELNLDIPIAGLAKDDRHRTSKRALHSELDDIKGIGPKTRDELLKVLKTVKKIREAELATLAEIIGPAKAKIVFEHFQSGNK